MTATAPGRALPLRVPITGGESLDSWLEALARRNGISIRTLLPAFGWRPPAAAIGLSLAIPDQILRRIERQTGLSARQLDHMVLDRYLVLGGVRREGSRYCPQCLAGHDGRWQLTWRLPWVFACTAHRLLLHDRCPACRRPARGNLGPAGLNPAGCCPQPTGPGTRCGADLREVSRCEANRRMLDAQQQISSLLAAGTATAQAAAAGTLADLTITAAWLLRQAPGHHVAGFGSQAGTAWQDWHQQPPGRRSQPPYGSAALAGALAALALPVTAPADDGEGIRQIRSWLPAGAHRGTPRPPGMTPRQWHRLSATAQGRFLRALDPQLSPRDRIRYRSGTPAARQPSQDPDQIAARARLIPQLLWPGWAIRLMPSSGFLPVPFRATIAACLMLPGNPARTARDQAIAAHTYRSAHAANAVLGSLAAGGHDSVLAAAASLAGYLDTSGSPIDYQHRRDAIPARILQQRRWLDICDQASAHPGEDQRRLHASRYLYQQLTGADLNDPRCPLTFRSKADRARYLGFTDTLTTPLRAALHQHAVTILRSTGIGEPLTWEPPAYCCAGLTLPGRDPASIDLHHVQQLVIIQGLPPGTAAAQLGTTISHIRLALEHVHRPAPEWGRNTPPVVRHWQQRASSLLTREFFEREYIQHRKTLRQIQAETGFPRKYLAERAREHQITLTSAFKPAPINPDWLREQYLTRQRSYTSIAAELGVRDVTVIAAARRHEIPSRPPGVHSHPEMISALGNHIPPDIRRAAEGKLHGWHRLHRFQAAMAFPTIKQAARHLGAHPSALISQFQRLERDIGAVLYHRAAPGQPMHPTERGTALLHALNQPEVKALATGQHATSPPPR
jgi:hypothetical protein